MSAEDTGDEAAMMPPALTSTVYDYDYDTVRPYFFLDGEADDFYPPCHQLLPGPGEDIWKKFELLQTPPLSPSRRPSPSDPPLSAANHLEAVSNLLDEDCGPSASFLQSFVIQDCMWSSSFAAATKLEEVVSEWLVSLRSRRDSSSSDGVTEGQVGGSQVSTDMTAADCVDPSVVFTSEPDSESEDKEDEDVDVVTVNGPKASRPADSAPLLLTRPHVDIHQHNYAAQRPTAPPAVRPLGSEVACRSPQSDSEGGDDRRRTHNVLERRRRSELKTSFSTLRDLIPALANQDKAARVAILKEATEFIAKVRGEECRLRMTKDKLRKTSRELRRRLRRLQASR
ncbi:transcriptional regulator Myc-B isoform X1 [Solea solea]|uniref:transcriptional regulator Myc-B isoform X1 n=2 Tax=Solea solea TaxID=90069 RepID=UPI00272B9F62|nr:transcriptional regulator Myc-B isoform X1 [Solea solea]